MFFLSWIKKRLPPKGKTKKQNNLDISQLRELTQKEKLQKKLEQNIALIREYHGNSLGLQVRKIKIGSQNSSAALVFIEGMVDTASMDVLLNALLRNSLRDTLPGGGYSLLSYLNEKIIPFPEVTEVKDLDALFDQVLMGSTALLLEGTATALAIDTAGWKTRDIEESDAEISIRGPRESFNESIHDNLSLIRRRLRVPQLWVEGFRLGSLSRTQVAVVYIKGLAGEEMLEEVRTRLQQIDTDSIIESGQVEEFIEDTPFTFLPLFLRTERPDRVTASLAEGQVAIFTDGSPFALLAPVTLFNMLQAPEDSFEKVFIGTFLRFLRLAAITISTFLPGLFVAVLNFHPEILPTTLFLRIASAREGIPFPLVFELAIMEFVFEILREAGVRLPAAIGPAISIVGALVLGDAAIQAGIVSPPVVIVVALTAIASFAVPNFALGISGRLLRFLFVILGAVFGLFGLQIGIFILLVHLCALRSLGIPYMAPVAPFIWNDMKDNILRFWKWGQVTRPRLTGFQEPVRQSPRQAQRYYKPPSFRKKAGDEDED